MREEQVQEQQAHEHKRMETSQLQDHFREVVRSGAHDALAVLRGPDKHDLLHTRAHQGLTGDTVAASKIGVVSNEKDGRKREPVKTVTAQRGNEEKRGGEGAQPSLF